MQRLKKIVNITLLISVLIAAPLFALLNINQTQASAASTTAINCDNTYYSSANQKAVGALLAASEDTACQYGENGPSGTINQPSAATFCTSVFNNINSVGTTNVKISSTDGQDILKACEAGYNSVISVAKSDYCSKYPDNGSAGTENHTNLNGACENGEVYAKTAEQESKCDIFGTNKENGTTPFAACEDGYNHMVTDSTPSSAAITSCKPLSLSSASDALQECEKGYDDSTNNLGDENTGVCNENTDCEAGWTAATNVFNDKQFCPLSDFTGTTTDSAAEQQAACVAGYTAAQAGKDDSVCSTYSGADNTACEKGFAAGGGTPTTTTDCTANPDAASCQGQTVTCSIVWHNPLSWFVCPAVSSIQDIMNSLGSAITKYLTIPSYYFNAGSTTGKPLYEAWDSVRDIALALLAIITLVMVFSQAVSIGPFDAYTVKKVLPRLIIAAILITLSWPLIGLMIGISNGFGNGIRYLIFAPFRNLPAVSFSAGSEALVGGLGIGAALGLFGTLTLGLMAAVALFTGLIVIVLRQIIVILLAVLSPIALVLYIMPGTEKVWKMWWNSFWGVLIMFPLIEAFIAFGSVFSKITMASGNTGLLDKIIAYIAIYIPYFLLPMTVRFAGGMMQAIGGKVTQISSGAQKGLNKRRKETVIRNKQEGKYGGRFKGTNPVSKGLSSAYGAIFAGPRGWVPGGSGKAVRSQNKLIGDAMYKKENAGWQIGQFDSSAVRLAATGFSADENEQRGKEAYAAGMKDYTASMKALETADTSTPEKAAEVEAKTAAVKALAKKHKDTLDQTLAAIARGKAAGMYTPQGQRAAFERAGLSGGAMFTSQDEARQAARRIAGNDDNVYGNMLGSFEHNATDAGLLTLTA
jgi:hypothetical protein